MTSDIHTGVAHAHGVAHAADHAVQMLALFGHHVQHVALADKDEEDPDSLGGVANKLLVQLSALPPYLGHVKGVGEDESHGTDIYILENPAEDLGIPGDAHAEEETMVDAHLVNHLLPGGLLARGAPAAVDVFVV